MFGLLGMVGNYEDRLVNNTKVNGCTIDTVRVTDSTKDYETAIRCPLYNDGMWIVVELYDTKKQAKIGHEKWVEKFMDKTKFPVQIEDVSTAEILTIVGLSNDRVFKKKEENNG